MWVVSCVLPVIGQLMAASTDSDVICMEEWLQRQQQPTVDSDEVRRDEDGGAWSQIDGWEDCLHQTEMRSMQ